MTRISIMLAAISTLAVLTLFAQSASAHEIVVTKVTPPKITMPKMTPKLNNNAITIKQKDTSPTSQSNVGGSTKIQTPALDASSKDAAKLGIFKFAPGDKVEAGSENIKRTKTYNSVNPNAITLPPR